MSTYSKLGIKDRLLLSKISALEKLLVATGRWTKDSDVGLIALSRDPMDRLIAEHITGYFENLSGDAKAVLESN